MISNHKNSITIVMARRLLRPRRRTSSSPKASKANGKAFLPLGPSLVFACSNCSLVLYVCSVWVQVGFVKNRSRIYTTNRSWYAQNLCTLHANVMRNVYVCGPYLKRSTRILRTFLVFLCRLLPASLNDTASDASTCLFATERCARH